MPSSGSGSRPRPPKAAERIKTIIEGGKALAQFQHMGDAAATKIIDQASVSDRRSRCSTKAPATDVWDHIQKVIEEIKAMHGHHAKRSRPASPRRTESKDVSLSLRERGGG